MTAGAYFTYRAIQNGKIAEWGITSVDDLSVPNGIDFVEQHSSDGIAKVLGTELSDEFTEITDSKGSRLGYLFTGESSKEKTPSSDASVPSADISKVIGRNGSELGYLNLGEKHSDEPKAESKVVEDKADRKITPSTDSVRSKFDDSMKKEIDRLLEQEQKFGSDSTTDRAKEAQTVIKNLYDTLLSDLLK